MFCDWINCCLNQGFNFRAMNDIYYKNMSKDVFCTNWKHTKRKWQTLFFVVDVCEISNPEYQIFSNNSSFTKEKNNYTGFMYCLYLRHFTLFRVCSNLAKVVYQHRLTNVRAAEWNFHIIKMSCCQQDIGRKPQIASRIYME